MKSDSIYIPISGGHNLHLKHWHSDKSNGESVFLLHGIMENGKIFYSDSGKGYAPFLAKSGYDVFVGDLRGRGGSTPKISRQSTFGQQEALEEDIPAFLGYMLEHTNSNRIHLAGHSWGGVDLIAFLLRTNLEFSCPSIVLFGSKRYMQLRNLQTLFMLHFASTAIVGLSDFFFGYTDALKFRVGTDNVTTKTSNDTREWSRKKSEWKHWADGFDYLSALRDFQLPPILFFAGAGDKMMGHPKDVQYFSEEIGDHQNTKFQLLSKQNGNLHNYNHTTLLTHRDAPKDHFQIALDWMKNHSNCI